MIYRLDLHNDLLSLILNLSPSETGHAVDLIGHVKYPLIDSFICIRYPYGLWSYKYRVIIVQGMETVKFIFDNYKN
jgi:hypothetical protein